MRHNKGVVTDGFCKRIRGDVHLLLLVPAATVVSWMHACFALMEREQEITIHPLFAVAFIVFFIGFRR